MGKKRDRLTAVPIFPLLSLFPLFFPIFPIFHPNFSPPVCFRTLCLGEICFFFFIQGWTRLCHGRERDLLIRGLDLFQKNCGREDGSRISLKSSWDLATSSEYELRLNRQHNYLNWSKLIQQSETGYDLSFLTSLVRISESKLHDAFMKMS